MLYKTVKEEVLGKNQGGKFCIMYKHGRCWLRKSPNTDNMFYRRATDFLHTLEDMHILNYEKEMKKKNAQNIHSVYAG